MEAQVLLDKYFETAFSAPDGVKKLRELILSLAMQGKLVPQDPSDQPASELLKEIKLEKESLIKKGKIKKEKLLFQPLQNSNIYKLPKNWELCRISDLGFVVGGKRLPKGHNYSEIPTPYRYLTVTNMKERTIVDNEVKYINEDTYKAISKYIITKNDLYITIAGTVGSIGLIPDRSDGMNLTENAARFIFFNCNKEFLIFLLSSNFVQEQFGNLTNQMAQPKLSLRSILSTIILLPPLQEQKRIVEKIDCLMEQCDRLEKLREEHHQKRLIIHTAARDRLLNAIDQNSLNQSWNFIQNNFGELYSVKENVSELRKIILQLAVMGKLVPQDPNDTPASELVKEIEAEKQRLIKEGKIKKQKPLPEIVLDEIPYKIPNSWEWVRLGTVGSFERGKSKHRPRNDKRLFDNGTYPFIQTGDVSKAKYTNNKITTISGYYNEFGLEQSRLWAEETLCITIAANIAETGFLNFVACVPDSIVTFSSSNNSLSKFVKIFIDVVKEDLENYAPATAQKNINLGIINDLIFPLPSLQEQSRIIKKVDQLMKMCDQLEQQIEQSTDKRTKLLNAILSNIQ